MFLESNRNLLTHLLKQQFLYDPPKRACRKFTRKVSPLLSFSAMPAGTLPPAAAPSPMGADALHWRGKLRARGDLPGIARWAGPHRRALRDQNPNQSNCPHRTSLLVKPEGNHSWGFWAPFCPTDHLLSSLPLHCLEACTL